MAQGLSEFEVLVGDCISRAETLAIRARQLTAEEFPGDEPVRLAEAIERLGKEISKYLAGESAAGAATVKHIRTVDQITCTLAWVLRYADGAQTSKVPWSLVIPLRKFCRRLVPDAAIILRPQWRWNYTILLDDLHYCLRQMVDTLLPTPVLDEVFCQLRGALHSIAFPFIDKNSVLLHAGVGHEVGHLLIGRYLAEEPDVLPPDLRAKVEAAVDEDIKSGRVIALKRSNEVAVRMQEVADYRRRAVEEIGADIVGVRMMGPAALFCARIVASGRDLNKAPQNSPEKYPPWRMRLDALLDELRRLGLCDTDEIESEAAPESVKTACAYHRCLDDIEQLVQEPPAGQRTGWDLPARLGYEWFDRTLPRIRAYVENECDGKSAAQERMSFLRKCMYLADVRLAAELPPNVVSDDPEDQPAASLEEVVNAAWLYRIRHMTPPSDACEGLVAFRDEYQKLNRLSLRAIELANLQEEYRAYHDCAMS